VAKPHATRVISEKDSLKWSSDIASGGDASRLAAITALADAGAVNSWTDKSGRTALELCLRNARMDGLRTLIGAGVDLHHRNKEGHTALIYACIDLPSGSGQLKELLEIVKLLLNDPGIDPNAVDNGGNTAFMWAVASKYGALQALLLSDSRIDPHIASKDGTTALKIAVRSGQTALVQKLKETAPKTAAPDAAASANTRHEDTTALAAILARVVLANKLADARTAGNIRELLEKLDS